MKKKYFNWPVIGALLMGMTLMVSYNAMAYKVGEESRTTLMPNKSDNTLIKEVISNQGEILSILRDIQAKTK